MHVLVTGGAGFIGTHLSRRLLREGYTVTILDNFSPQIHGKDGGLAADLVGHVQLITGDVRDPATLAQALAGQQAVVHLAAETGTGQSMYQVAHYASVNLQGTAQLLDALVNTPDRSVEKLVVASSRAIYGEGKYHCAEHQTVYPPLRQTADLEAGNFEPRCPICGSFCTPLPTDETAPLQPVSFYGLTKQTQEQMVLMFGASLGISAFALRYQNVYGPGQSLQNPYTGILAIFSNLARAGQTINVFEDGAESRDFVYIDDVVEATFRSVAPAAQGTMALNVGSGERVSVREVAERIAAHFGGASSVQVSGAFRLGDIRHNLADLTRAQAALGYQPRWRFAEGLAQFLAWAAASEPAGQGYAQSLAELRERGLFRD